MAAVNIYNLVRKTLIMLIIIMKVVIINCQNNGDDDDDDDIYIYVHMHVYDSPNQLLSGCLPRDCSIMCNLKTIAFEMATMNS